MTFPLRLARASRTRCLFVGFPPMWDIRFVVERTEEGHVWFQVLWSDATAGVWFVRHE